MPRLTIAVLAACFLALPISALSQNNDAQSSGGEENLQPNSEIKTFNSWNVQCVRNQQSGANVCTLFQSLNVETGERLVTMLVNKLPPREGQTDAEAVVVTVPLGVHLPSGLQMKVDNGTPIDLIFERCDQAGCYAGAVLTSDFLKALIAGENNQITFYNLQGRTITATLSLSGFTAGYRSLTGS